MSITTLTAKELRKAADLKERIAKLETELSQLLGSPAKASAKLAKKKGGMSAAGRTAVADAQRTRWAKVNAAKGKSPAKPMKKTRKKLTAAVKAKMSAAARARWAEQKVGEEVNC